MIQFYVKFLSSKPYLLNLVGFRIFNTDAVNLRRWVSGRGARCFRPDTALPHPSPLLSESQNRSVSGNDSGNLCHQTSSCLVFNPGPWRLPQSDKWTMKTGRGFRVSQTSCEKASLSRGQKKPAKCS